MKVGIPIFGFAFLLFFVSGCLFNPSYIIDTSNVSLTGSGSMPYTIEVAQNNDGSSEVFWDIDSEITQKDITKLNYHRLYDKFKFIVVGGTINGSEKEYPVIIDTGASQEIFVNTSHVLENNLNIYKFPGNVNKEYNAVYGLCYLENLKIGDVEFIQLPCLYLKPPVKSLFFFQQSHTKNALILGLKALREFKFIQLDNRNKQILFSYSKEYQPKNDWHSYPMYIEEDLGGNAFLFITIPIQGREMQLQLDTGSGNGLAIGQKTWQSISQGLPKTSFKKSSQLYPYIGNLPCQKGVIKKLSIGRSKIDNAKIAVFPENSPLLKNCDGMLGMEYFEKTTLVLDFWNEKLWVQP